jgi:hypothetical protein
MALHPILKRFTSFFTVYLWKCTYCLPVNTWSPCFWLSKVLHVWRAPPPPANVVKYTKTAEFLQCTVDKECWENNAKTEIE